MMKKASSHRVLVALYFLLAATFMTGQRAVAAVMGGEVHGSVYALIRGEKIGAKVDPYLFLPDISVYLQNVATSATSPPTTTDLDGAFMVPAQPQAEYRLCWKTDGYSPDCSPKTFVLRSENVNLQPVGIMALPGVIFGRVALKDGHACRFVAPFLGVNTSTTVTAILGSTLVKTVHANSYGEYVLPGLTDNGVPSGTFAVTASCEGAKASNSSTLTGSSVVDNLTLPNASPIVLLAYAAEGGHSVRSVSPGTMVKVSVQAKDGGGFPLHYRWASDPPTAGFVSQDAAAVNWKIQGSGLATMYVLARDGRGGNVLSRVTLSTTPNHILFSGLVTANDAPVVSGATVNINGTSGVTDSQGQFTLALPKENPRYVVTIEKPGYQMLSRALYAPIVGATFKLYRAQDFVVDPTRKIGVTEKPPRGQEHNGVQILIGANSLAAGARGQGSQAAGPLHIEAATYNLHDPEDQLPGDYGGTDATGKAYRLQTFGAASIDIRDAAGHPFNLAPGKTATINMPIDPALLAAAPPTIPVWHYDVRRGLWLKEGTAHRAGNNYTAKVTHFSPVNMDLAFNDGACTRIVVDTGIMPVPFKIQMTPLTGNFTVDANHQNQVIGDSLNVVVREPPGISVRFDMIDSAGNPITAASQTITIGAASPSGSMWNPPPNPPYADCTSEVRYDVHTVQALFPAPPQGFLSYRTPAPYLDPATAPALTAAYYSKIDPGGTKTAPGDVNDFAHWKTANGFDRPGETRTIYQNDYDLGFGRDMHMQKGGQDGLCTSCIAYFVTNYLSVQDAVTGFLNNGVNQKATVAMEFSPQNGSSGTAYTKFYVFNNDGLPATSPGSIANSAALDDFGPKFVPTLCITCHNGNVSSMGPDGNLGTARFIPFDLHSFAYDSNDAGGQFARTAAGVESNFRELNRGVLSNTNASAPVRLLITHWYGPEGDTNLLNLPFDDGAVPGLWTSPPPDESNLYKAVVEPSCRSCHTTRDPGDTGFDISWQSFDSLNSDSVTARIYACTPAGALHHIMPQAERTFARFWLSTQPNGPATIAGSDLSAFQAPNNNCQ